MLRTKNLITNGTLQGYNNAVLQINRTQKQQKSELQSVYREQVKYAEEFDNKYAELKSAVEVLNNAVEFLELLARSW